MNTLKQLVKISKNKPREINKEKEFSVYQTLKIK